MFSTLLTLMVSLKFSLVFDLPWFGQLMFQDPATPIMEGVVALHHDIMFFIVSIVVFVFWILIETVYLFKSYDLVPLPFSHETKVEVIWTIVPIGILFLICMPSFSLLYAIDEVVKPSLTLKAIGRQWYWSYEYLPVVKHVPTIQHLKLLKYDSRVVFNAPTTLKYLEADSSVVIPSRVHVSVLVTSADVLHSWAVPSLGVKIDACPGRLNEITFYAKSNGIFYGQCSEICGVGHSYMPINVISLPFKSFYFWYMERVNAL